MFTLYFKINGTNTHVINKLQFLYQRLRKNDKFMDFVLYKSYHSSPRTISKITNLSKNATQQLKVDKRYVHTDINIQNNIFLYKWETNYFRNMRWLLLASLVCSVGICYTSYDPRLYSMLTEDISWRNYFKALGLNILFLTFGITIGPLAIITLYFASQRFIKYIILHKGGKEITLITYHLLKNENILKLPANEIQTRMARSEGKVYVILKIKNRKFFYLLDSTGKFFNEDLFDNTIGMEKKW